MAKIYQPDNSQATQVYGTPAQQVITIPLGSQDASQGLQLPQIEGSFLYVEHADFPVQMSFVNAATNIRQTIVARTGAYIRGLFKGLVLTWPPMGALAVSNLQPTLKIVVGRDPTSNYGNEYPSPFSSMPSACINITTATALSRVCTVFMPAGTRRVAELEFCLPATTITRSRWLMKSGAAYAVNVNDIVSNGVNYAGNFALTGYLDIATVATGVMRVRTENLPVPTWVDGLELEIIGTGLSAIETCKAIFE